MEKITMLGVTGSGKTCFIYAMYDFMQKVQNGFTFITNDPDVDMDLNEGWESIAFDGHWPDGTQGVNTYDFTVLFKSRPIMEFSWCDYRGGALLERSTEQDVKVLHNTIFDSECLIICIGADKIKAIISGDIRKAHKEMVRLNNLILRYANERKRRIPIIFALTKADLYTPQDQQQVLGIIKEYFSSLYQQGSGWFFAVVPVSLGNFEDSENNDKLIRGIVAPKNIHIPVLFFLHSILKERILNIQNKLKGISSDKNQYRQEIVKNQGRTWWSKFWNGDNTSTLSSRIDTLNNEEQNISKQMAELEQAFANMKDMFSVCKFFYEGQQITL